MPFERPLFDDIRRRVADDLENKLPGADARLRVNNLRAFSEVEAGTTHLLYGRLDWSFRQLFPDTAELEYLERWASIWGIKRVPAAKAAGPASWEAEAGAAIPNGAIIRRGDGVLYTAAVGASEANGRIILQLEARAGGRAGNADPGTQLTLATTAAGVAVQGQVDDPGLAGGADQQSDELLLRAVLARIQAPPHGGAWFDYVRWALEVPGVTRAWCYPLELGPGTVTVRFMMDEVRYPTGIPEQADVDLVAAHIADVRPVTADVYVFAPINISQNVTIGALEPDTPDIRAMIVEGLYQMLLQEAEPAGSIYLSQWHGAIAFTPGVRRFVLLEPTNQVDRGTGEIVGLGQVSFV